MSESIAWAAGLFEGEGSITRRQTGRRVYLEMCIEMRDRDVVERFVAVVQQNGALPTNGQPAQICTRTRNNPLHSDMVSWHTTGHTAERVFLLLRPYLGERRRAKGDSILEEARRVRAVLLRPRICEECGEQFEVNDYGHHKRFCTSLCNSRWYVKQPGRREADRRSGAKYRARLREAAS